MKEDYALEISNVSKKFMLPHEKQSSLKNLVTGMFNNGGNSTEQIALKNIDLKIKKGEFFGIVGRNGSGKSTLLKIIAGIYQPTSGKVSVYGKLVPFIELGVGFNPELTGRENVFLNGAILGFNRKQINQNYKKIVDFAELEDHMDVKLKNYSSGMQVRLAFACATMAKADILLIDEVLAVGDADFQRKCYNYFKDLKQRNITVIFVTHDMGAVNEYCDRAAFINNSVIELVSEPSSISLKYEKLFNKYTKPKQKKDSNKWGNRDVAFIKNPGILVGKNNIVIQAESVVHKPINDIVFGVSIVNAAGQVVLGTNSKILRKNYKSIKEGDHVGIKWKIPNILSSGKYTLDIAMHDPDGITVYERWDKCLYFEVNNLQNTPNIVSPDCKLEVVIN